MSLFKKKVELDIDDLILNKEEKLLKLFEYDKQHPVEYVLEKTGIKTAHSLRTWFWSLRKSAVINLKIKFGFVIKE